jgi:selenocysteine lyase/cysteine desulfurase
MHIVQLSSRRLCEPDDGTEKEVPQWRAMDIDEARSLWSPKTVYLNTASYGLPPQPAWDALQNALEDWRHGRTDWLGWDEAVAPSRAAFARMVGVPTEWIAVGSNVSAMAGLVGTSLPVGSVVVVPEIEFTSNLFPWLVQRERDIEVRMVKPERLIDSIDDTVTLIAFSVVQSASGAITDISRAVETAQSHGARVFVDATQACGWLPIDARDVHYLAAGAYKWLMSPRGTAFMSLRPECFDEIRPLAAGWYAGEDVHASYYGPPLRLAESARRFDISPAWFSWVGTLRALEVIESIGVQKIHEHNVALANRFLSGLGLPEGGSAIVSVDAAEATEQLRRAGIMAATRAGRLRASFHLYNTREDVDATLAALGA